MQNLTKKIIDVLKKRTALVVVLCIFMFVVSIIILFTLEKRSLDKEYNSLIKGSLNIHTEQNAAHIDQAINDAERAIRTAETMLRLAKIGNPQNFLEQRNASNPVYTVEYISMEQLQENSLSEFVHSNDEEALQSLIRGETVAGDILYNKSLEDYCLAVIVPIREQDRTTGALYTYIKADDLFPNISESVVYQHIESSIITDSGEIIFNTFVREQTGNIFDTLEAYGLTHNDISNISRIIGNPDMDNVTFERNGDTYFISAAGLKHNEWYLVSFVRGPDVLIRSADIFQNVVQTSSIAILITASLACIILFQLLFSNKRLEEEQQRNNMMVQRLQSMFVQHSALKVVFDPETGNIVDANPAILRYFGYTESEVIGHPVQKFNLLPPEIMYEKFQGELNGEALFYAAPHRLKSGETRLLDVYASVIMDGDRRLLYSILFDVTEREIYRQELLQEKELLSTTLRSIGDGVVTTNNEGIITSLNSIAEQLTGWTSSNAVGRPFTDIFILRNEDTGNPVSNPIQKVLETGLVIGLANHTELINRHGDNIPIADSAAPIKSEDGKTFGVVMVFRDVSDEKEHNEQIKFLSYHDSLTGLYNRRYIEETMSNLDGAEHQPVSVIMADVNGLKITNDVFGHKAGDTLLKSVADLMKKCCKNTDLIARWGGDEFVILMPGTGVELAEEVISKIKNTHVEIEGINLSLSLSLGCACKDTGRISIHAAMQQAEEYMYHQNLLEGKSYRNAIISTLLATLYEKSNETEEHSKRMEEYCHAIGRQLQLTSNEMDELSLLSLLHDIGKVSIHPNILQKPGALTPEEWDEMKKHPEIGYRIAQATPELTVVADLILSHHERWDGMGYPRGLKEEQIPLACRILSVVDAFDAMTNDRIYRKALTVYEAILELESNAGKQFDPRISGILIEIIVSEGKG